MNKYKLIVTGLIVITCFGYHFYKVSSLQNNIIELQETLAKANKAIEDQNKAIEQAALPENFQQVIEDKNKNLDKSTKITINKINTELQKDNSAETELKIIESTLKEFSNGF